MSSKQEFLVVQCQTIIAQSSPLIDDAMLKDMASHLHGLKRLTLWGCTRVTKTGVFDVLREAEDLEELSLDALPHSVRFPFHLAATVSDAVFTGLDGPLRLT